ncbi:MAG: hypothetical protein U0167_19210 [bacterium]
MFAMTRGKAFGRGMLLGAALLPGLPLGSAWAVDPPPGKMARQIDVMERILDQVLLDSPNFLVHGRPDARGLYVKEFGVIVSFDASLVEKDNDKNWNFDLGKGFKIVEENGKKVIIFDSDSTAADEDKDAKRAKKAAKPSGKESTQERLYKRGKAEIVDTLLDYGDTMTTLESGKWVAIVAFLHDSRYFDERGMSRLILQAKIDDLRLYSADKLSEEEMVKRIVEQEY